MPPMRRLGIGNGSSDTASVNKQLNAEVCCRAFIQRGTIGQRRVSPQRGGYQLFTMGGTESH